MIVTIQLRRDLAANWTTNNPVLHQGEIGFETDTTKLKIGDGVTAWTTLAYWSSIGSTAAQNTVFAGPVSGGPGSVAFRALTVTDIPTLNQSTTGNAATATNLAGAATFPAKVAPKVITLVDGSSVALDASQGNVFRWALSASSHTLAAPSNPADGQMIRVRIIYSGAFTPLFNAAYEFGTDGQPSWSSASGKIDEVGFMYDSDANTGAGAWTCAGSKLGYT